MQVSALHNALRWRSLLFFSHFLLLVVVVVVVLFMLVDVDMVVVVVVVVAVVSRSNTFYIYRECQLNMEGANQYVVCCPMLWLHAHETHS
jgi:hypothetical protein